jgi:hypothetical protein
VGWGLVTRLIERFSFGARGLRAAPLLLIGTRHQLLSPASIIMRTAAERDIGGSWPAAHLSSALIVFSGKRSATSGSLPPVAGRPRFFGITAIDFRAMLWLYLKCEPVKSGNFPPALTSITELDP